MDWKLFRTQILLLFRYIFDLFLILFCILARMYILMIICIMIASNTLIRLFEVCDAQGILLYYLQNDIDDKKDY